MESTRVITVPTGRYDGRSYILLCPQGHCAAVFDPDINVDTILDILAREVAEVKYILLTHGHFDHVSSADALREKTGAKTAIHKLDIPTFSDPNLNMSGPFGLPPVAGRQVDIVLEEGSELDLCGVTIKVLHTPGHTPGSCCYLVGNEMFTGDTLFRGAYGNTGFPGGNMEALTQSCSRLFELDGSIAIHPGHGGSSTIARERESNPIKSL